MLAADLGGALFTGGHLAATLELELPGVVSPWISQSLLLDLDVTLHPILCREVDLRSCPVEWVHPSFVPSYSPDLNPIEQAFSKIENILRKLGARTH